MLPLRNSLQQVNISPIKQIFLLNQDCKNELGILLIPWIGNLLNRDFPVPVLSFRF